MSAAGMLTVYRVAFVALLMFASAQALLGGHVGGHSSVPLAATEIAAAAALLLRRTELPAACVLLGVFAVALILSALEGHWPTQFMQYAASTLLIVGMGRALGNPGAGTPAGCRADKH